MHIYIYIYIYICIYIYIHTHMHIHIHLYIFTSIHLYIYTSIHICIVVEGEVEGRLVILMLIVHAALVYGSIVQKYSTQLFSVNPSQGSHREESDARAARRRALLRGCRLQHHLLQVLGGHRRSALPGHTVRCEAARWQSFLESAPPCTMSFLEKCDPLSHSRPRFHNGFNRIG